MYDGIAENGWRKRWRNVSVCEAALSGPEPSGVRFDSIVSCDVEAVERIQGTFLTGTELWDWVRMMAESRRICAGVPSTRPETRSWAQRMGTVDREEIGRVPESPPRWSECDSLVDFLEWWVCAECDILQPESELIRNTRSRSSRFFCERRCSSTRRFLLRG